MPLKTSCEKIIRRNYGDFKMIRPGVSLGISLGVSLLTIKTPKGTFTVKRPDKETVEKTKNIAKQIFIEAFSTTYTQYYNDSKVEAPIEKWLVLKDGFTITTWLDATFEGEYEEYLEGKKDFLHLYDEKETLVGWLSHGPVSDKGEMYLSQCSLEAGHRNSKIATTAFSEVIKDDTIKTIFPGVKEVKLIAREINKFAERLYLTAGFTKDRTIDPKIYGECYNDRYVGYRKTL